MNKTIKKIGLILIIIILLPAVFLTVNELTSYNENEKVIEKIYADQLEAILFSVNQYSEDVVGSWATRIDDLLDELDTIHRDKISKKVESLYVELPSLVGFFIADSIHDSKIEFYVMQDNTSFENLNEDSVNLAVKDLLIENQKIVKRLYTYKRGGYRKIEPINSDYFNEASILIFIEETSSKTNRLTGLILNPVQFVYRILSPKIQEIAEDKFIIAVRNPRGNFAFNSNKEFNAANIQQEKAMWIFPDYRLGISLLGKTIEDLVEQRVVTNIILISLLTLVLIFGVWIVFRNVKKEVQLAQIKSDFVSNVSHELRTPLSLISMFSETLDMGRVTSEEKKKEYYKIISQESSRLSRIVNTILNFSKMEAGKRTFHFKELDLNEFVQIIFNNYSFHLKNKGFEFNFTKQEDLPKIYVDEEAVSEAIINLIDNAVKYSNEKKEIEIKSGKEKDFVFIEVIDKGIGVSNDDQKKIFEKFFRASTGLVHNTKGTGLGLTLVKFIMDAHRGTIKLNSTLGKGSSFKLIFPIRNKSFKQ